MSATRRTFHFIELPVKERIGERRTLPQAPLHLNTLKLEEKLLSADLSLLLQKITFCHQQCNKYRIQQIITTVTHDEVTTFNHLSITSPVTNRLRVKVFKMLTPPTYTTIKVKKTAITC